MASSAVVHSTPVHLLFSTSTNHRKLKLRKHTKSLSSPLSSKSQLAVLHSDPLHLRTRSLDLDSQILKFCSLGKLTEAMKIITSSCCDTSSISSDAYCSILQLCGELLSLDYGKRTHSILCNSGTEIDTILGQKLVFMYLKCGDLIGARRVFDEIAHKANILTWSLLMNEYVKIGDFKESLLLFKHMHGLGIEPDSYIFTSILKCFAALLSAKEGQMAHGYAIKLGFGSHDAVGNALVLFYSKLKRIETAINLFDKMPHRNVISWNTIISSCMSNGLSTRAIELFNDMLLEGVAINVATVVSVLPACAQLGYISIGRAIHAYCIKSGLILELQLCNSLMDMYSKCSNVDSTVQIFKSMKQRSVVSWTAMIMAYTQQGHYDQAIDLFLVMEQESYIPDEFVITSVLRACACKGSSKDGRLIHDFAVRNGMVQNTFVANALMDMYVKCGNMEEARSIFDSTVNKDIISWNTLIGGYSKHGFPNDALKLFSEIPCRIKPNSITMACLLPAVAGLSCLERGREIHAYVIRAGFVRNHQVENALVDMYVKCGALILAHALFDRIYEKDLVTWTVMIAGYGMHGHGTESISLFKQMRRKGMQPDEISFVAVLYACSHSGLLHEGWYFFNMMRNEYQIEPKLEHYACMVDMLSRAGRLEKAYEFIKSMPIKPDSTVWGALLCGCRIYKDIKLAEIAAEKIFELEPDNTGFYVLLANIYTEAEKWEEVKRLRERIGGRGLKKTPGCSWIETRGKVQVFLSGNNSHPQKERIKKFVEDIMQRMKEEDQYIPNKRYALMVNVEDRMKEEALCGHSEKLAIAFGFMNSPNGRPIRVAKNLRVCGDCHEFAKFVSKVTGRDIVLRDLNRFHKFEEGRCSCRGYW
jgi:pentatricopeptide repeat protein